MRKPWQMKSAERTLAQWQRKALREKSRAEAASDIGYSKERTARGPYQWHSAEAIGHERRHSIWRNLESIRIKTEAETTHKRLLSGKHIALARDFMNETQWLRRKIPSVLLQDAKMNIAKVKLNTIKMAETIAGRFETLEIALPELSKKEAFVGKNAMFFDKYILENLTTKRYHGSSLLYGRGSSELATETSPRHLAMERMHLAGDLVNWAVTRNCSSLILFDMSAFRSNSPPGKGDFFYWGRIKKMEGKHAIPTPILGIVVYDPNPKKLLEIAKLMAKRRPNDPIPIIDLYGRAFYP